MLKFKKYYFMTPDYIKFKEKVKNNLVVLQSLLATVLFYFVCSFIMWDILWFTNLSDSIKMVVIISYLTVISYVRFPNHFFRIFFIFCGGTLIYALPLLFFIHDKMHMDFGWLFYSFESVKLRLCLVLVVLLIGGWTAICLNTEASDLD
jgi:hypothetical protein